MFDFLETSVLELQSCEVQLDTLISLSKIMLLSFWPELASNYVELIPEYMVDGTWEEEWLKILEVGL